MNDIPNVPPPLPASKPRRGWGIFKFIAGSAVALVVIATIANLISSPELEVVRQGAFMLDDGKLIEFTNVGTKPISITKITINDRADCTVRTPDQKFDAIGRATSAAKGDPKNNQFQASILAVGDKAKYVSSCRLIRAAVDTDQGSASYSFQ